MTDSTSRPATPTPNMPGSAGAGCRGFIAPDSTRIVVKVTHHEFNDPDIAASHVGFVFSAWEVDASGAIVGDSIPSWVHTVPMVALVSGNVTLDSVLATSEDGSVRKVLARKAIRSALASLDIAPPDAAPVIVQPVLPDTVAIMARLDKPPKPAPPVITKTPPPVVETSTAVPSSNK